MTLLAFLVGGVSAYYIGKLSAYGEMEDAISYYDAYSIEAEDDEEGEP